MPSQRLEARIKKLCEEALRAEQRELEGLFQELLTLLHEHNELLKKLLANKQSAMRQPPAPAPSPRKRNGRSS